MCSCFWEPTLMLSDGISPVCLVTPWAVVKARKRSVFGNQFCDLRLRHCEKWAWLLLKDSQSPRLIRSTDAHPDLLAASSLPLVGVPWTKFIGKELVPESLHLIFAGFQLCVNCYPNQTFPSWRPRFYFKCRMSIGCQSCLTKLYYMPCIPSRILSHTG